MLARAVYQSGLYLLHGNIAFKRGCAARKEMRNQITVHAAIKIGQKHSCYELFSWIVQEDPLRLPHIYPLPRVHDIGKAPLDARANAVEHLTLLICACQCDIKVRVTDTKHKFSTCRVPQAFLMWDKMG